MTMPLIINLLLILSHCILAQQGQLHSHHHHHEQQRHHQQDEQHHLSTISSPVHPNPTITIQDGKLHYNNIIYDFRPAFPPYSMEKLNELLLFQRTVTIKERGDHVDHETHLEHEVVQDDANIDITPAVDNDDDIFHATANAYVEDVVADMRKNEPNAEEERGEEDEEEIKTIATTTILPSEIVAEDDTISLHIQSDEMIADDNVDSNRGNADMGTAVNETTNDSIKEGTSEAKAEELGETSKPKAEDVVEVADDFVEGAASIMQPMSIVDVQDDTIQEEEKQDHDDDSSTDDSNIDSIKSSIDGMKLQQETYNEEEEEEEEEEEDDENISSTTTTTPSLSDDGGDNGEATTLSVRKDHMVPEVGETNGGDHSFSSVESELENADEDGQIIVGGEDSLLVSSEHVSDDGGEESHSTSAQQDEGIVKEDNLNAEESNADGGDDTGGDETKQSLSVKDDIPTMDNKEANRQFVDGLDELDKLFEPVEVPDELDVGADGTSMQEVLFVGQGLKIIWKNVKRVLFALGGNRSVVDRDDFERDSVMLGDNGDIIVSFDTSIQDEKVQHHQGDIADAIKKQPTRENKEEDEMDHRKAKKFFPILIKSPKTQKILKFAKRKFEQAKHILGDLLSIFEGTDIDDDDEFELFGDMGLDDDIRQSVESARRTVALHGGSGGTDERFDDVDESFLKSRFEAMNTATAKVEPVE